MNYQQLVLQIYLEFIFFTALCFNIFWADLLLPRQVLLLPRPILLPPRPILLLPRPMLLCVDPLAVNLQLIEEFQDGVSSAAAGGHNIHISSYNHMVY